MDEIFIKNLQLLLDNGLYEEFDSFERPLVVHSEFLLSRMLPVFARLLRDREETPNVAALLAVLERLVARVPSKSISRFRVSTYIVRCRPLLPRSSPLPACRECLRA